MSSLTPTVCPLRQRMIDDMRMRTLDGKAQIHHIRAARRFAAFLKRSPDTATADDLRTFQLHMVDTGTAPPTANAEQKKRFVRRICGRVLAPEACQARDTERVRRS